MTVYIDECQMPDNRLGAAVLKFCAEHRLRFDNAADLTRATIEVLRADPALAVEYKDMPVILRAQRSATLKVAS